MRRLALHNFSIRQNDVRPRCPLLALNAKRSPGQSGADRRSDLLKYVATVADEPTIRSSSFTFRLASLSNVPRHLRRVAPCLHAAFIKRSPEGLVIVPGYWLISWPNLPSHLHACLSPFVPRYPSHVESRRFGQLLGDAIGQPAPQESHFGLWRGEQPEGSLPPRAPIAGPTLSVSMLCALWAL